METKNGKVLLISDIRTRKTIAKVENLRDFAEVCRDAMRSPLSGKLKMGLRKAIKDGKVDRWLRNIGEEDIAERMKAFESRLTLEYTEMFRTAFKCMSNLPKHSFSDVVGLEEEKKLLLERISYPHKMAELSRKYGKQSCGNILLYGPPGCGKTFVAKALAKETGKLFVEREPGELMEDFFPPKEMVRNLHEFGGAVLFIDEMETISMERDFREDLRFATNSFLVTLDALPIDSKVSIIGATNLPWMIDNAMLRSGRFDSSVYVGVPDHKARAHLFRQFSSGFPNKSLDFEKLASRTEFYSCADIEEICSEAASIPWRDAIAGKPEREVTQEDFDSVLSTFASTTIPWFENASTVVFSEAGKKKFGPMVEEIKRYKQRKSALKAGGYG